MECQPLRKINEAAICANKRHVELRLHESRYRGIGLGGPAGLSSCVHVSVCISLKLSEIQRKRTKKRITFIRNTRNHML